MDLYVALATLTKVVSNKFGGSVPIDPTDNQAVVEIMNRTIPADNHRAGIVADVILSEFMLVDVPSDWDDINIELWGAIADAFHSNLAPPPSWSFDLSLGAIIFLLNV